MKVNMVDVLKSRLPTLTGAQKLLGVLYISVVAIPLLPLPASPKLFSPVDSRFLWAIVGVGVILSQAIWWTLFTPGTWKSRSVSLKIMTGMLSILFSAMFGIIFGLRAGTLYSFYELRHLGHDQREMLYYVEAISDAGRGGPHAYVNPYGFGRWGLPISGPDYHAFRTANLSPTGLVCYRVTEVRRGDVIGILHSSEWHTPSGALVPCITSDRRFVMNATDFRANWN